MEDQIHKSGFVALIGRPNAGKSTLLNKILGSKLAAVTPRPQTTRNRIFGIYDTEDMQIIFQDTPGLLDAKDALDNFMVHEAKRALDDSDVAVWLIDSIKGISAREKVIADKFLSKLNIPLIVVFNKIDKIPEEEWQTVTSRLDEITFETPPIVLQISALKGDGVNFLINAVSDRLGEGPKFYPSEQLSDRTERFFVEEMIREQAFLCLREELPYSLAVQLEDMKIRDNGVAAIKAVILVERDSQKGILLGKGGGMIKKIGSQARQELETFLDTKVFLELWIKVAPHWKKSQKQLKELGYGE
jgi:GTP-binding protein Era